MSPGMRFLLDLGPIALFFLLFQTHGLMIATGALIGATLLSLGISWAKTKRLPLGPLISATVIGLFGGLTLALNDETFIKLKPTIVSGIFACILLGGAYGLRKGLLRHVLEMAFTLSEEGWRILSARWGYFFLLLAVVNELVWRNTSTELWVQFKTFGLMGLTILFTFTQMPLIRRHQLEETSPD